MNVSGQTTCDVETLWSPPAARSHMQVAVWGRRVPFERMRCCCRMRDLRLRGGRHVERMSPEPAHFAGWEAIRGLCEHVCAAVARQMLQLCA